jgi:hypothetical protein
MKNPGARSSGPATPLRVPRRLCYALGGMALFGTLSCSDPRPPDDASGSDTVVSDVVADVSVPDSRADTAPDTATGDGPGADRRDAMIIFTFECAAKDPAADPPPNCPEGKQTTTEFPPECPEGCEPVGLG